MSRLKTTTLTPTIGAVLENVDLSKALDDEIIAAIRSKLLKHPAIISANR